MQTRLLLLASFGLWACAPSHLSRGEAALASSDWKLAIAEFDAAARQASLEERSFDTVHTEVREALGRRSEAAKAGLAATLVEARRLISAGDFKGGRALARALLQAPWVPHAPTDATVDAQANALLDESLGRLLRKELDDGLAAQQQGYPQVAAAHAREVLLGARRLGGAAGSLGAEALALQTTAAQAFCDRAVAKALDEKTDPSEAAEALTVAARADWFPPSRPQLIARLAVAQATLASRLLARLEAGSPADYRVLHAVITVLSQTPLDARAPLLARLQAARKRAAEAHLSLAAQEERLPAARAAHLAMAAAYGAGLPPAEVASFLAREGVRVALHPAQVLDPKCRGLGGTWLTGPLDRWTQPNGAILIEVDLTLKACATTENRTTTAARYETETIESRYPCRHFDTRHLVYVDGTCTQTRQVSVTKEYPSTSTTYEARLDADLSFRWEGGEERMEFNVASSNSNASAASNGIGINSHAPMVSSFLKMHQRLLDGLLAEGAQAAEAGNAELATDRYLAATMGRSPSSARNDEVLHYLYARFGSGPAALLDFATGKSSEDLASAAPSVLDQGAVPDPLRYLDSANPPLLCCGPAFGEEEPHTSFEKAPALAR